MFDSLQRGECPFASHLLYTQCLDDEDPEHRKLGMEAGFKWAQLAVGRIVYCDFGISKGMKEGLWQGRELGQTIEFRYLDPVALRAFRRGEEPSKTIGF